MDPFAAAMSQPLDAFAAAMVVEAPPAAAAMVVEAPPAVVEAPLASGGGAGPEGACDAAGSPEPQGRPIRSDSSALGARTPMRGKQQRPSASLAPSSGRKKRERPITSKLTAITPETVMDQGGIMSTVFVPSPGPGNKWHKVGEAPAKLEPVPIWPQYTLTNHEGTFIVIGMLERWLNTMLHIMRARSPKSTSCPGGSTATTMESFRVMSKNLTASLRLMLQKALREVGAETADMDGDLEDDQPKSRRHTCSGYTIENAALLNLTIAHCPIQIANYGKAFIVRLDENARCFIQTVICDLIKKLSDSIDTSVQDSPRDTTVREVASFRFDDSTPNIRDKIVWCPDDNAWKLILQKKGRGRALAFEWFDHEGKSLAVPKDLGGDEYDAAKLLAYGRAIEAWNILDTGKRFRIPKPVTVDISPTASSDVVQDPYTQDSGNAPFQSMLTRWDDDDFKKA